MPEWVDGRSVGGNEWVKLHVGYMKVLGRVDGSSQEGERERETERKREREKEKTTKKKEKSKKMIPCQCYHISDALVKQVKAQDTTHSPQKRHF